MPKININTNKIKALCSSKGISLNELFIASEISRQNWYYHVKNRSIPLKVLENFCYHLNCRPNDLFDIEYEIKDLPTESLTEKDEHYVPNPDLLREIENDAQNILNNVEILKDGRI